MEKPDKVYYHRVNLDQFFVAWLVYLRPSHNMTDRQIDVAASFLKIRYELSKTISDDAVLDDYIMNESIKKKVRQSCKGEVSQAFFQVLMGDLRRHGFIKDGRINPMYIPNLPKDNPSRFSLMFFFEFVKDESKQD